MKETLYKKTKLKNRHNLVRPLREAGFTMKEVREFGTKVSAKLWKSCLNDTPRNLGK